MQVEPVRDPCGPAAGTVIGNFDPRRMFDDASFIEVRELGRNTANEMPSVVAAGRKIGHRNGTCWTKCWTLCWTNSDPETGQSPMFLLNLLGLRGNHWEWVERVKGIEPSSSAWKTSALHAISAPVPKNETQNELIERKSKFSVSGTAWWGEEGGAVWQFRPLYTDPMLDAWAEARSRRGRPRKLFTPIPPAVSEPMPDPDAQPARPRKTPQRKRGETG